LRHTTQLENVYNNDETGALAMEVDNNWDGGEHYVYIFYGSFGGNGKSEGMRLERFNHEENDGNLQSRGNWKSAKMLWHDSDGWGNKPQWHYGASLQFGPDDNLYLTLGTFNSKNVVLV
jgi:hypothetical protein